MVCDGTSVKGRAPAVAVVIPVHDAEETVAACVESVLAQDFTELEVVVVDDGSKDRSGEICDRYASADQRVRVVHQENRERSAARLAGVEASTAGWVSFVDADDRLPRTAVSALYAAASEEVDIVVGNGAALAGDYPAAEGRRQIPLDEFRHLAVRAEGTIGVPWGHLFRRSLVTAGTMGFPREICNGEDYLFWLRAVFLTAKPVNVVYEKVYDKGKDTTSSRFVWDAEYAYMVHEWRKKCIPESLHGTYMADMIADRMVNLMAVARCGRASEWRRSRFRAELETDMARAGYAVPFGARLYLSLPSLRMRKLYSALSECKGRLRRMAFT